MGAPLSTWPWNNLGIYKYVMYGPIAAKALFEIRSGKFDDWSLQLLVFFSLRTLFHQYWHTFVSMLFLTRKRLIVRDGIDFKQIDDEWDWDNFLILQALIGSSVIQLLSQSSTKELPLWNFKGLLIVLMIHVVFSEPFYYVMHRCFHKGSLFTEYHSVHHSSRVPHPYTAGYGTPLDQSVLCVAMGAPILGALLMGYGSVILIYGYILTFDFLRCMGYSNVEIFSWKLFEAFPFLKYLIYTPTYESLHYKQKNGNFCLFMPLFDYLGNTVIANSWELQKEISSGKHDIVPDFVFLVHVIDVIASMHVPFVIRSYASMPYENRLIYFPFWLTAFGYMLLVWAFSKTFLVSFYKLRGSLFQTWAVPRYGFHYFLPFAKDGINKLIELAILRADKMGVKVLSLAALNKNEALNGGGTLFVRKHPNLRVRVVHGNTLTAAVILNEIPTDVKEVFLNGATSKLGRAIALYLCRKKIRVLMLTLSAERFQNIQKEAPADCQQYLVQVTKYQAAQNIKTWIVGKWISPTEQRWAPPGTHFHQFVIPTIIGFRRDCTYGTLAAMRLPKDVEGLGVCEYTMARGVVHACHAGGVVHFLEGWTHHEVGAIDVDQIDVVWEAALKHGLTPV